MKIILTNGTELTPIIVTGGTRYVNGSRRDTLNFIFAESTSLDELDALFTNSNCETIKIIESVTAEDGTVSETEYIHSGYVVRAELSRAPKVLQVATEDTEAVIENRVTVSMAKRTYEEEQLANLAVQNAMLEDCIVEMAEIVYA